MPSKPFSIPLAGSYNTRVSTPNVLLGPSSGIVGVGIVGVMIVGLASAQATTKDQRFVNCFSERVVNTFTGKVKIYLVKRPGFATSLTPQAGSVGNAILIWTGSSSKIISAFGATNSSIYDSATQLVTNNADTTVITGKARSITETELSGTATITIASSDSTGWVYQPAGTVTKIADADYPGNAGFTTVGGFAHMDGYGFIMDSLGRIWNSDINSMTAWTATSFVTANSYPDQGIGCVRHGDRILAFGTESVQVFHNAGNASGSPLSRVEPLTKKVGCVSADAIAQLGDSIYWAGSSPEGGIGIWKYAPEPQKISTPEIDTILLLAGAANITLASTVWYGRHFVILTAGTVSFGYCVEEQQWFEMAGPVNLWYKSAGVSTGSAQVTYWVSKTSTSGKVFVVDPAALTFQDNGEMLTAFVQTSPLGEDGALTYWDSVGVEYDVQPSASDLTISCNDADYDDSSYEVLGTIDMTQTRPLPLSRCGSAYRRAYVITHSHNTPMRLGNLYGRMTMGT